MSDAGRTDLGQKITTGPNDRPRNETIAQTGAGIPDDTSRPVEVDEAEVARVRAKLLGEGSDSPKAGSGAPSNSGAGSSDNPDAVPAGTPLAAENICRHCGGTGRADGGECPECTGTGVVLTPVGGAG
ncbi:MAG TPA: hypothetical protein VGN97_09275 [Mesorhizobium sp.]|jgi:hypothetical protein|nr:hypothetical protein [Mesorhizobium sp.]